MPQVVQKVCLAVPVPNDYVLKLYNGDIGIAVPDHSGDLLVHFRSADGSSRAIAPRRLPAPCRLSRRLESGVS